MALDVDLNERYWALKESSDPLVISSGFRVWDDSGQIAIQGEALETEYYLYDFGLDNPSAFWLFDNVYITTGIIIVLTVVVVTVIAVFCCRKSEPVEKFGEKDPDI